MGGMMGMSGWGAMVAWIVLWTILAAAVVTGSIVLARMVASRRGDSHEIPATRTPGLEEAQAILRQRYARGEITREDYLQGKVELEDSEQR
jgi:putative membrane protein